MDTSYSRPQQGKEQSQPRVMAQLSPHLVAKEKPDVCRKWWLHEL